MKKYYFKSSKVLKKFIKYKPIRKKSKLNERNILGKISNDLIRNLLNPVIGTTDGHLTGEDQIASAGIIEIFSCQIINIADVMMNLLLGSQSRFINLSMWNSKLIKTGLMKLNKNSSLIKESRKALILIRLSHNKFIPIHKLKDVVNAKNM